ncbi:MFS multidrug transporter [Patellaria atrata CBS 101060]|uniref:MFS multidrug transporter n=1 Tax=Patellaria atrata CBS 101060 TaxID=1346257 RepID=A0A9P4S6G9_9PEZI|nr:MFS multidrug transporter [Patellaria atrata CBS 101060]
MPVVSAHASSTSPPSETSPLLAESNNHTATLLPTTSAAEFIEAQSVEPGAGIAPEAPYPHGDYHDAAIDGATHEDAEDQRSIPERIAQYEGMPEVKKQMKYIFPALGVGVFLASADQTIIVSSYGKIGTELNALSTTSWIATAYLLTLTSFQPLYGKLSDIFGRKACLLFAYTIFGLGCIGCGVAKDMKQLIAARAFAGIGGGGMTTVVSILLSDVVSLRDRGKWQGYINIIYATGSGVGAPMGGIMSDSIGWRWAFLFQAPLCLVAFVAVGLTLHLPRKSDSHWKSKLRRIDFPGALILICAVFSLLLGLDRGSNLGWKAQAAYIPLAISLPLFLLFIFVEMKVASEPFTPGHIIFERSLVALYLCNFFSFAGWLAAIFYIPLFWQVTDDIGSTQAGIQLIPSIIAGVSGSLFGGFYMAKTGKYYWLTVAAYSGLTLGVILIFLFSGIIIRFSLAMIVGMIVCGFSNGIGVTSSLIGLIANSSREDQAIATACSYLFRSLGSVVGVSLSATVTNQVLRSQLKSQLRGNADAGKIAENVRQSLDYFKALEPSLKAVVADCYARGLRSAFALQMALVCGAAVSAWFVREQKLSR